MTLRSVRIAGVRNLSAVELQLGAGLNAVVGANGSGKTAVLEAVHLLSQGKSFRTGPSRQLIQHGARAATVSAIQENGGALSLLGLSLDARACRRRIDGVDLDGQAEFAVRLPCVTVQPSAQSLLESAPEGRRRLMDWGAFYQQGRPFLALWRRYAQALAQRNAELRHSVTAPSLDSWEHELARSAQALSQARRAYLAELMPQLSLTTRRLIGADVSPSWRYVQGWAEDEALAALLRASREQDRRAGYTRLGAQRADLLLSVDGLAVQHRLSRGQLKLWVVALKLAQALVLQQRGMTPCLLVDDVPAELDAVNRDTVLSYLNEIGLQALVTATEAERFGALWGADQLRRFQLEQGAVHSLDAP